MKFLYIISHSETFDEILAHYFPFFSLHHKLLKLFISERPMAFFAILASLLALLSIGITVPLVLTYLDTGLVPRFPTAILATGLMLCAMLSLVCGAVLHTVTMGRQEIKRLIYLSIPAWQKI